MRGLDGITDTMDMSLSKLVCCSPWDDKELGMAERLKLTYNDTDTLSQIEYELLACYHLCAIFNITM